ncbi:MAG: hypothetical protein ACRBB3_05095 [Alphaproteobacteria bacterium]
MAKLDPLIRVRKHTIEQKKKFLASLYAKDEELKEQEDTLKTQLAIETEKAKDLGAEMMGYFGAYADSVSVQLEELAVVRQHMEDRIKIAQDDVRNAFADLKKIEIIDERRKADILADMDKRESIEIDEIAIDMFMRNNDND